MAFWKKEVMRRLTEGKKRHLVQSLKSLVMQDLHHHFSGLFAAQEIHCLVNIGLVQG